MTKTTNYQLNQWAASDPIRRADFNADNAAIDAAIKAVEQTAASALAAYKQTTNAALGARAQIVTGSYVGTGTCGSSSPNVLDFADTLGTVPKFLFVVGSEACLILTPGVTSQISYASYTCTISWTDTGVQWYNTDVAAGQMNRKSTTYYYVAVT